MHGLMKQDGYLQIYFKGLQYFIQITADCVLFKYISNISQWNLIYNRCRSQWTSCHLYFTSVVLLLHFNANWFQGDECKCWWECCYTACSVNQCMIGYIWLVKQLILHSHISDTEHFKYLILLFFLSLCFHSGNIESARSKRLMWFCLVTTTYYAASQK